MTIQPFRRINLDDVLEDDWEARPTLPRLVDDENVDLSSLTWDQLVEREPRLGELLKEIRSRRHDCALNAWYGHRSRGIDGYKQRLLSLAGWEAERDDRVLRTSQAYDLCYDLLYAAVRCKECRCV